MHLKKADVFFLSLAVLMAGVVVLSNFLVQFPFKYYSLENVLTFGAFSYPVAFLITDSTNRIFGPKIARKIVYIGFLVGVLFSFFLAFENINLIAIRIVVGSGLAFLIAQLIDVKIFDILRNKIWFLPPLISSLFSSTIDTFIFFFVAFYATSANWMYLAIGDLCVKFFVAMFMLIPFRALIYFTKSFIVEEKV